MKIKVLQSVIKLQIAIKQSEIPFDVIMEFEHMCSNSVRRKQKQRPTLNRKSLL